MAKRAKQPRTLTENQAWRVIEQLFRGQTGLCLAVYNLECAGLITAEQAHRMSLRLRRYGVRRLGITGIQYWFPCAHNRRCETDDARVGVARALCRGSR